MKRNPTRSGYAPVNGIRMYYEIYGGQGMPLLLIHGGGSTIDTSFSRLLPLLRPERQVIAAELQAHGRTEDRDVPESFSQDAADVAELLRWLTISRADILGFSNGGTTAMRLAMDYPRLVNRLILVSALYRRDGLRPGFFEGMGQATLADMPFALQEGFLGVNPDRRALLNMFNKDKERMLAFSDWPDEDLRAIHTPALVISGDRDIVLPAHSLALAALIQGSRLVLLPGVHGACIGTAESEAGADLPRTTATILNAFLGGAYD